jgi:hypothetical protein
MKKTENVTAGTTSTTRGYRRDRPDNGEAFIPDPSVVGRARAHDPLAEELAEEFLESATTANEVTADRMDEPVAEEEGGPFVVSPASNEYADDVDLANPADAEAEPLPSPMRGVR